MKLVKLLSSVIVEDTNGKLIKEISEKVKNALIKKFEGETKDDVKDISAVIDYFERIKDGLPAEKRDITKYTYQDLSVLVKTKMAVKQIETAFKNFKKREPKTDNKDLLQNIKKFSDIKNFLQSNKKNIDKYTFLELVKLNKDNWEKLVNKNALEKFTKENPSLTSDQILFYINEYIDSFNELPKNTPSIFDMSFDELEHLIDGLESKKQGKTTKGKDYSGVEVIYDKDNLLIFNPKTKDQCIKLRNGRSWCTSREGGSNMYYNYRLENNLTLYYVIDEDKNFNDLNYATVILVDERGRKKMADGSNSGRYGGSQVLSWDEISGKVEKLADKEDLFVAKPLSTEEQELLRKYRNVRVGENPIKELGGEEEAGLWLEMNSPKLSDTQYENLTPELQKKYIALGMDLTTGQLNSSSNEVIKYYLNRKAESLKTKKLSDLSKEDIALLNLGVNKQLKEELKEKFAKELVGKKGENKIDISYPNDADAKFIVLYGFNDLFENIPDTIGRIILKNTSGDNLGLDIPKSITRFKNLSALVLTNIVRSLPEEIGQLENLEVLSLSNNSELKKLPQSIMNLPELMFVVLSGSNPELPKGFTEKFSEDNPGYWSASE